MKSTLATAYNIHDATLSPIPHGAVNRNYVVQANEGPYVLKHYSTLHYSPEHIARTCDVQSYVWESGLRVPEIVKNEAGEWITPVEDGFVVLSRFVSGRHHIRGHIHEKPAYQSGATLARLQEHLAKLPDDQSFALKSLPDALRDTESLLRKAEAHRHRSPVDEVACSILRYKLQALQSRSDLSQVAQHLPSQWVHGDYHEVNLLFTAEDEVAAVIDFDNMRCMPRGLEVMRAISLMFFTRQSGLEPHAYKFFEGFTRHTPTLTEAELTLYVPLRRYYALSRHWPLEARYEAPERYDERWDHYIQPPSDWWERNAEGVTERLLQIRARCQ
ncbi:phosphotransferase [Tumebacillus sp. ITR2]|uniref:Phosphotransferase n=1 Tax=Tumebacillus amylolyticus TaxID=2801339 RepID=A0ABS1JC03_9BACL|nr:phosphotransferase [Tumebacillus amylolyticus]MBL0387804.1 phosphotransferase [Tumebacillus amylolyticus]